MIGTVFEYRAAGPQDAEAIAQTTHEGLASYAAFLPPGWGPPPPQLEASRALERLAEPESWLWIAFDDGSPAGHAGVTQARTRDEAREPIAGVAHLFHLFVRPPWWGSGLAAELHRLAGEEA